MSGEQIEKMGPVGIKDLGDVAALNIFYLRVLDGVYVAADKGSVAVAEAVGVCGLKDTGALAPLGNRGFDPDIEGERGVLEGVVARGVAERDLFRLGQCSVDVKEQGGRLDGSGMGREIVEGKGEGAVYGLFIALLDEGGRRCWTSGPGSSRRSGRSAWARRPIEPWRWPPGLLPGRSRR